MRSTDLTIIPIETPSLADLPPRTMTYVRERRRTGVSTQAVELVVEPRRAALRQRAVDRGCAEGDG